MIWTRRRARLKTAALVLVAGFACDRSPAPALHDDLGRPVALPKSVSRAVTLAPNLTEMMFAAGAGQKVVCTDDYSDFPAAAKTLPKVGGLEPNIEKIVACRPDVVLATTNGNHPNLAPALEAVHVPLYVVRTDRLDDIANTIAKLGDLFSAGEAHGTADRLRAALEQQRRRRSPSPRVMFAVWTNPLYVAGRNTFADDLFALTGATNAVTVPGWPQYSLESLLANPPDIFLYPRTAVGPAAIEQLFRAAPELRARMQLVPVDDNLFTRPGPRVPETAQQLSSILDGWSMLHK
jgi:ABC-type hemin transport system substrate-binding protein